VAVFVDGCFWHVCPKHGNVPANNRAFWKRKLTANGVRDVLVSRTLRRQGWRVVRIWEHDLRKPDRVLRRIQTALARLKKRRKELFKPRTTRTTRKKIPRSRI